MIAGVGTDLVEIARIQNAIEKNPHFMERVYTKEEIAYCQRKKNPWQSFAARFAAKEAVSKAFGTGIGPVGLTEIEIRNKSNGQPEVVLHGKAQAMADSRNIQRVHVSLSHSETYAMATAVLEGEI
ncbi:MAG: holo-ACP synthase [Peptococcaceae bacterium]|nr:holo-ACP synthase [Peptococcaceae bacterium]